MPTQCKPISFAFQGCQGRKVTAAFDGGSITSNGGALLLRAADRSIGLIDRVAACFTDHRDARLTEHSVRTLVAQRVMGIALGHEDLNDHDELRHDPLLALLAGKLEGHRKNCAALAGKSTLNRLEHAPPAGRAGAVPQDRARCGRAAGRAARVVHRRLEGEEAVPARAGHRLDRRRGPRPPGGRLLPRLLQPLLLPAAVHHLRRPPALRAAEAGQRGSRRRREGAARPHRRTAPAAVAGTGDPASGRLRLCPRGDPGLVRGQRRRLRHRPGPELAARREDRLGAGRRPSRSETACAGQPAGSRSSLYATLTSWSRKRRVVAKAEHLPGKSNPRFVVTSLPDTFSARTVYERVYCPRGNMENAIKEQQLDLFSDRTSASRFACQPAPAPLLRLRLDPLPGSAACATRRVVAKTACGALSSLLGRWSFSFSSPWLLSGLEHFSSNLGEAGLATVLALGLLSGDYCTTTAGQSGVAMRRASYWIATGIGSAADVWHPAMVDTTWITCRE